MATGIIEITTNKDLPKQYYCYVSEPSVENALAQFKQSFDLVPVNVLVWRKKSGKVNVYIPVDDDFTDFYLRSQITKSAPGVNL